MPVVSKIDTDRPARRVKTGGRKKGTPNKTNAVIRAAIEEADPIAFLIGVMRGKVPASSDDDGSMSDLGDVPSAAERIRAAEFLAKRIAPEVRERPMAFELPAITHPADALEAMMKITAALAAGQILPGEAKALNETLRHYLSGFETIELADRLEALEATLQAGAS